MICQDCRDPNVTAFVPAGRPRWQLCEPCLDLRYLDWYKREVTKWGFK